MNLVLKEIDRKEKANAYFNSITTARLAHIVVQGLGGKDAGRKMKMDDLLPFKSKDVFGRPTSDCTARTSGVIRRLIKTGKMPIVLVPHLIEEIDA